ncbi:phage protein Gp27 family protein [Dyella sp. 20L07]|uniref:phage protein Gp27 family protein n=1 Tax=Dyella sp. 20L07 TaxID=3384240 RepID=UPI003D2C071D
MPRRSTIEQLPRELADVCHRLIREGRTIHEITDALNQLEAEVSKSAVGRYVKGAREQMRQYREAQEVAGQWVTQLNENPAGDVSALLAEMLKTVAFQTIANLGDGSDAPVGKDGKPKAPKAMDVMLLAKAIRDLEASTKASLERRERIERQALERQAKAAEKVAQKQGMSPEHWAQIRAEFLGIKDQAA